MASRARWPTGFALNATAISFDWKVSFTDDFGVSAQTYDSPAYFSSTWASPVFTSTGGDGPTRAQVLVPYSSAFLVNGSYCVSASPSESAIVY